MRSPAYRLWLRSFGYCEACRQSGLLARDPFTRIIDPCHTANNGLSSKGPDNSCAPLCRVHHREFDRGRTAFQAAYGIDMPALAAIWWGEWLRQHRDLPRVARRSEADTNKQIEAEAAGTALHYLGRYEKPYLAVKGWERYGHPPNGVDANPQQA
jgi:hypothetical protein